MPGESRAGGGVRSALPPASRAACRGPVELDGYPVPPIALPAEHAGVKQGSAWRHWRRCCCWRRVARSRVRCPRRRRSGSRRRGGSRLPARGTDGRRLARAGGEPCLAIAGRAAGREVCPGDRRLPGWVAGDRRLPLRRTDSRRLARAAGEPCRPVARPSRAGAACPRAWVSARPQRAGRRCSARQWRPRRGVRQCRPRQGRTGPRAARNAGWCSANPAAVSPIKTG